MSAPPSIRKIAPSLKIRDANKVTLNLADLTAVLSSLEISVQGSVVPPSATIKMSIEDLRKIFRVVLSNVSVDEAWYVEQVFGLRGDIEKGSFGSATEHYRMHGYLEGRLPERPVVDENFYLQQYPDVAAAIRAGRVTSALDHYVRDGYAEGRWASADAKAKEYVWERKAAET